MRLVFPLLLVATLAASAGARPSGAKGLERKADDHRRAGRFVEAFADYREAWIAHPAPRYLYRLGQCEHLRGEEERALFFFQAYLDLRAIPPFKKKVERHVAEARDLLATARTQRAAPRLAVLPVASGEKREALAAEALTEQIHGAVAKQTDGPVRGLDRTYKDLHLAGLVGVDCKADDEACVRSLMPLLQVDAIVVAADAPAGMTLRVISADPGVSAKETPLVLSQLQDSLDRVLR